MNNKKKPTKVISLGAEYKAQASSPPHLGKLTTLTTGPPRAFVTLKNCCFICYSFTATIY